MAALGGAWARDWQLLVEESSWGGQPLGRSHSVPMVGGGVSARQRLSVLTFLSGVDQSIFVLCCRRVTCFKGIYITEPRSRSSLHFYVSRVVAVCLNAKVIAPISGSDHILSDLTTDTLQAHLSSCVLRPATH